MEVSGSSVTADGVMLLARPMSTTVYFWMIVGVATTLRLLFLGNDSLWVDEAASVAKARMPWLTFITFVAQYDPNMPLYYGLLHLWLRLGDSEAAIRLLSVIPAVLSVPVLYLLGKRLFNARVGLLSALFLALNAFHLNQSQEARSYSLLVLLVTLSALCFVRAVEQPSRRNWALYVLTSALAVYSHLFGSLALVAHGAALLFRRPREVPWGYALWSAAAIGVLVFPLGLALLIRDVWELGWYNDRPGALSVVRVLYVLTGGVLPLLAYGIVVMSTTVGAARVWLAGRYSSEAWRFGFVYSWLVLPLVVAFGISLFSPLFISRYLIICLPALTLLAAIGVSGFSSKTRLAAMVVFVVVAGHSVASYYTEPPAENWRDATQYLLSRARDGDAVIIYVARTRPAFEYYRDRLTGTGVGPIVVFPPDQPGSGVAEIWVDRKPDTTLLEQVTRSHHRVWLMLSHERVPEGRRVATLAIQKFLARRYPINEEKQFRGVRIVAYSREYRSD